MNQSVNISHVDGSTQSVTITSDVLVEGWEEVSESNSATWNDPQKSQSLISRNFGVNYFPAESVRFSIGIEN